MPTMSIRIRHDSTRYLESVSENIEALNVDVYDVTIDPELTCPRCDGDVQGVLKPGHWEYSCPLCHYVMKRDWT